MNLNKGCIEISDHRLGVDSWKEMNLNKGCIEIRVGVACQCKKEMNLNKGCIEIV